MSMENGLVTSSILKQRRGYDRSFHSAFVATVLLQFYEEIGIPSKLNFSIDSITQTIEELRSKSQFLTNHGKNILEELEKLVTHHLVIKR
jgi:hypothetical protein